MTIINGYIIITRLEAGGVEYLDFQWEGGPVVGVADITFDERLFDLFHNVNVTDEGGEITARFGQYRARLIEYDAARDLYVFERMEPELDRLATCN